MEKSIDKIYYFDYSKDIGFYDSFRNFQSREIEYMGLALSTQKIQVNAPPIRYTINQKGTAMIKGFVAAHLHELYEMDEATQAQKYILVCYSDDSEQYFQYNDEFCKVFDYAKEYEMKDDNIAANAPNPYTIQPEANSWVPSPSQENTPNVQTQTKPLGMKWYTFFVKIRPWIVIVFSVLFLLSYIETIPLLLDVEIFGISYLLYIVGYFAEVVLHVILLKKTNTTKAELLEWIKLILIFETCYFSYGYAMQQYDQGAEMGFTMIVAIIALALGYFIWYRCNMKYFEKRLAEDKTLNNLNVG